MAAALLDLAILTGFATIHHTISKIRFIDVLPRSRWLSFAGGIALSYVFLHLLPELSRYNQTYGELTLYLLALLSFSLFYSVEQYVYHRAAQEKSSTDYQLLVIHTVSFAAYNVLVGCLLAWEESRENIYLLLYVIAIGLHLVTVDYSLWKNHQHQYKKTVRWILMASLFVGWILPHLVTIPNSVIHAMFAFVAGATILNVIKEELPKERQSNVPAFLTGLVIYSVVLYLLTRL